MKLKHKHICLSIIFVNYYLLEVELATNNIGKTSFTLLVILYLILSFHIVFC